MIGNDIIDLNISKTEEKASDSRFLEKLFTKEEERIIEKSASPEICLWRLWSMKEAVYKAHQRKFNLPGKFNPKAFECTIISATKGNVIVEGISYKIHTRLTSEFIHSITGNISFFQKLYSEGNIEKDRIIQDIASEFGLQANTIKLEKDANNIPWIKLENTLKRLPFSLSHHGSFTGFIIPLINS